MYPKPLAKRQVLEGAVKDYGFELIAKAPTKSELNKWGITQPHDNNYAIEEVYDHALECAKKYWEFDNPQGYGESFQLGSGRFTSDVISPERIAAVWLALAKYESGDRDASYFPQQFFTDIDVEYNGKTKHYDIVPLFARNVSNGVSSPNLMSAGCLAFGMGNISAYCDVIQNQEMARRAAWDWKYNIELSVMTLSRKWYIAESKSKGLLLDAAVIYYHGWDGNDESCEEYLSRLELDEKGKEKRSSKRYYDEVKGLYLASIEERRKHNELLNEKTSNEAPKEKEENMNIKNELGKIGVRGGHAVTDNVLPLKYGYPAYVEGKYVHNLSQKISDEFGFVNLEPEAEKLEWAVIAKRGREAQCDTILYNHTNFSVNSKGELNSGTVIIIYPFENEEYKPMYEMMAEILAHHMGLPKWATRIRMSTNYENKNYYSALHYGKKYGIRHPLIVEYGYHVDIAGREEERSEQILSAFREMLEVKQEELAETEFVQEDLIDLVGLRDRLASVSAMIDELLEMIAVE